MAAANVADIEAASHLFDEAVQADLIATFLALLYEVGVDEAFQGQGVGKALVAALRDHAMARDCRGMWVLTDHDNAAALATYRAAGADEPDPQVLLEWTF